MGMVSLVDFCPKSTYQSGDWSDFLRITGRILEELPYRGMRTASILFTASLTSTLAILGCSSTPSNEPLVGAGGTAPSTGGVAAATGGVAATGGADPGVGTGGTDPGAATGGASASLPLPPEELSAAPVRDGFTLLWEDDFDRLNPTHWGTASHTFTENAAQFTPSMVTVADGYLRLGLEKDPTPGDRAYMGGEIRTKETFTYGRFETRARFATGSGVVSSMFTFYDHYADANLDENWNEIDLEFLGKNTDSVQWNVIHWDANSKYTSHEEHTTVSFNPSEEFHEYAIEWLPDRVNFYVDDALVHTQTDQVAEFVKLESKLMMNIWPVQDVAGLNSWAGKFDEASLPAAAYYDWIRVYSYDQ